MDNSTARYRSAIDAGLLTCHDCHALWPLTMESEHCRRCGAELHVRKPNAMIRTWALILTATFLLLPANLLPIMLITSLGHQQPATIIGGVIELGSHGMYGIAFIVLAASVLIPLGKLLGLLIMLAALQLGWTTNMQQKMAMFRLVHWIGRWSMLDIFVVAVLVALVQLGNIAQISGQPGATAFAGVVICTMLAANSFDTRLIWDRHMTQDTHTDEQRADT
ncbi:paraquat-inducible protein A [Nitrincola sp. MINF-07-Sa-05]|uniref:paraquat-inducible protein A n=1 Tax=Nitrincola salilacus TaxID=3400273 RepID=UPI003917E600